MWLFHSYACFSASDMARFYEDMAKKGFCLDKCNHFAEHFTKTKTSDIHFTAVPRSYFDLDLSLLPTKWKYLTQNRSYYVFTSTESDGNEIPMPLPEIKALGGLSLLKLIILTTLSYHVYDYRIKGHYDHFYIILVLALFLFWIGFVWSAFMETYEIGYYKQNKAFLPYSQLRYQISIIILILANMAHILLALSLFSLFF